MSNKGKRGRAGALALKKDKIEKVEKSLSKLKLQLDYYKDNNLTFTMKELSIKTGISTATLYREPYKSVIDNYKDKEYNSTTSEQIEMLVLKINGLNKEISELKEENRRLLKEITYSKNFFK